MRKRIEAILKQEIPYLDSPGSKLLLIGFISLYSFIFINIYAPYNINKWGENYYWEFILIGFSVLIFTQFILRTIFGPKRFKIYSLLPWGLMEMGLMAIIFEIAYSPPMRTLQEQISEFLLTFWQIGLVVVVPYTLFLWYAQIKQKLSSFKEEIQYNIKNTGTEGNSELLILHGENNKVVLAIKYNQLLYIKSAGNYLELFYFTGEKINKELIRMSFKELDEIISDPKVIRVHRSYMVNTVYINSAKKTKKGYALNIQYIPEEKIPVSFGYKTEFEKILQPKKMSH
ncbi:LytTr DNA-binding domain-containing protein [Arenibacter palladensis]|uniref:LytTr DNA-binding domain-containing protein n=1 Tax=Arenibacter palladensis TaxID=237373 RepID=A0A1M5EI77_9FLAO|nr:LytTR family DNA-binding domain-containing protein [Arenibacter palladensis]SHF78907.1 LytTr DNA-binding domain-containing protein [Arenibacter palladensis]